MAKPLCSNCQQGLSDGAFTVDIPLVEVECRICGDECQAAAEEENKVEQPTSSLGDFSPNCPE